MAEISIREAYEALGGGWVRIADIQSITGQTPEGLSWEVKRLMATEPAFRAEAEPMITRITDQDRRYGVRIGGQVRHLIRFE